MSWFCCSPQLFSGLAEDKFHRYWEFIPVLDCLTDSILMRFLQCELWITSAFETCRGQFPSVLRIYSSLGCLTDSILMGFLQCKVVECCFPGIGLYEVFPFLWSVWLPILTRYFSWLQFFMLYVFPCSGQFLSEIVFPEFLFVSHLFHFLLWRKCLTWCTDEILVDCNSNPYSIFLMVLCIWLL